MLCMVKAAMHVGTEVSHTCMKLLCLEAVLLLQTHHSVMRWHKVFVHLVLLRFKLTHLKLVQKGGCLWKQVKGVNKGNRYCAILQIVKL